jgi:hypothetical protein
MPRDPDHPITLTRWIDGMFRVHFRSGHIAEMSMSLHAAHSLRKQLDDKQGADAIGGLHAHTGWLWARHEEVVLTEWTPSVDYGWPDTADEERPILDALGMPHGILPALAELWREKHRHKAAYSINAVAALHTIATKEPDVTRDVWDRMAEMLEGEKGARLAKPEVFERTRYMTSTRQSGEDETDRQVVASDPVQAEERDAPESSPASDAATGERDSSSLGRKSKGSDPGSGHTGGETGDA